MNHRSLTLSAALLFCASVVLAESTTRPSVELETWTDAARDRALPVKLYLPADASAKVPVIFLSHGLGGSRNAMTYLGEHWSAHGYLVIALQHPGSDESVWRDAPPRERLAALQQAANAQNYLARAADVSFAIDHLIKLSATDPRFKDRVDLDQIGIAGHSFGAQTVQAIIGQRKGRLSVRDDRVKAAIAFSPGVSARTDAAEAFDAVDVPVFHFTGTKDEAPLVRDLKPEERRIPYDHIVHNDQYLLIFKDGDHAVFSGGEGRRRGAADASNDPLFHALIESSSLLFWDAYLRGDGAARDTLRGFDKSLGEHGTFEHKSNP